MKRQLLTVAALALVRGTVMAQDTLPFEHGGVYFRGNKVESQNGNHKSPSSPLVGLTLSKSAFLAYLTALVQPGDSVPALAVRAAVDKLFEKAAEPAKKPSKSERLSAFGAIANTMAGVFVVTRASDDDDPIGLDRVYVKPYKKGEDPVLVLILNGGGTSSSASYNGTYKVKLELAPLKALTDLNLKDIPAERLSSDELKWKERFSLSAKSDLTPKDTDLITKHDPDPDDADNNPKNFTVDTADVTHVGLELTYAGISNPLQGFLFLDESSYYDLTLDANIADKPLSSESKIKLSVSGVTDLFDFGDALAVTGFKLVTNQALSQIDQLYSLRMRLGDRRSRSNTYLPLSEVLSGPYLEIGFEGGYSFRRTLKNVYPEDNEPAASWIVRPLLKVGIHDQELFGARFTGSITGFYLIDKFSGSSETGIAEVFEAKIAFGPKNQRLELSVTGGRNPADNFRKIRPTYGLVVAVRF